MGNRAELRAYRPQDKTVSHPSPLQKQYSLQRNSSYKDEVYYLDLKLDPHAEPVEA